MTENLEELLAELLLDSDQHSSQESFLIYLVMEPFIRQFRATGLSNKDILDLCRKVDESKKNG